MARLNKKELARLSPEERIKKLREIEEEDKKELEETEKLLDETIDELRKPKEEAAPEAPVTEISELLAGEEGLGAEVREEETLEEAGAKYETYIPDYVPQERKEEGPIVKIEDQTKYESPADDASKSTAHDLVKHMKKYSKG